MSNAYGFDFLRTEHTLSGDQRQQIVQQQATPSTLEYFPQDKDEVAPSTHEKTDLEKQYDVIQFLQAHRSSGCLPPSIIYKSIGVDLSDGGRDESVTKLLLKNARIRVEEIPDPENPSLTIYTFGYQAKFNSVRNRIGLLAQVNRCKNGVRRRELLDSYEGIQEDIDELITSGEIIAVLNTEDKDKILFPRGEAMLVELDGHIMVNDLVSDEMMQQNIQGDGNGNVPNEAILEAMRKSHMERQQRLFTAETDVNPKKQIRRGEAICIGGQWFRVSSAVREGPLSDQPARAQAPLSVSSRKELSKKNEVEGYYRPFGERNIPLDHPLHKETIENVMAAKEAQTRLQRIAAAQGRAVTGGAGAQLLSSNATATNPETLAKAFVSTASSGHMRRRPTGARVHHAAHMNAKKAAEQVEEAKKAASDPCLIYSHARRHGCTLDVRDLYLATRDDIPVPEKEVDIYNMMIKYKLLEPNELMKRPRMSKKNMNLGEDGKPKKRRYYERKGQRMTNTHLIGTEIGQALAAAAEKQSRGKSVGDGGM